MKLSEKRILMLRKRLKSFKYAFQGIVDLFKHQPNARIHALLTVISLVAAAYFRISTTEWYLIIICIAMVFAAEAFNTSLEYLTDLVSPDYHELAGKAKDAAAAAVLFTAIGAFIIGICIFVPRLFVLLQQIFPKF